VIKANCGQEIEKRNPFELTLGCKIKTQEPEALQVPDCDAVRQLFFVIE